MGKVISFMNNKGGVAKTTTACAVGYAWAELGYKILFLDLDSQANLTSIVSGTNSTTQKWSRTLEDAFIEGPDPGLPILHTDNAGIDFVPTDLALANFDSETAKARFKEHLLSDLLQDVKDNYDFVIIDCPPALGTISYNAMVASDFLVLVTNAEGSSVKGLEMIVNLYNDVISNRHFDSKLEIIGCVVTRYERDNINKYFEGVLREQFGQLIIEPFIPKSTKVSQATSFHQVVYVLDPYGKISKSYIAVAQEIFLRIKDKNI